MSLCQIRKGPSRHKWCLIHRRGLYNQQDVPPMNQEAQQFGNCLGLSSWGLCNGKFSTLLREDIVFSLHFAEIDH